MKVQRIILTVTIVLLIVAITLIATIGINKKEDFRVINIVPDYTLGMELSKSRVLTFSVSDEVKETNIYDSTGNLVTEKEDGVEYTEENGYTTEEIMVNSDSSKMNVENYKANEKIFEERLNKLGVKQYNISFDETTGTISIEVPDDENVEAIAQYLKYNGTIELLDDETDEVVLDNTYMKKSQLIYGSEQHEDDGHIEQYVYLQIEYTKEGIEKIKELSSIYVATTTQETDENGETQDVSNEKKVDVIINGTSVGTTVMTNLIYGDTLAICLGYSTDIETFEAYNQNALAASIALNSGELSLEYEVTDTEKEHKISNQAKIITGCTLAVIFVIITIFAIVKYKSKGIIGAILEIGYISLLLLAVRGLKIVLTVEGILGLITSAALNYAFIFIMLENLKSNNAWKAITKTMLEFLIKTVPIMIIAVAFSFVTIDNINSLGYTLVWGFIICYLYNLTFTKAMYSLVLGGKNEK